MVPEQLYRSRSNRVFAGVCGGLAEYFKVDATLIRLAWALAFFIGGTGFILYILALLIMPDDPGYVAAKEPADPEDVSGKEREPYREEKKHQIFGLILIALGGYFLLERFFPFFNMHNWWPLVLILVGVFILFRNRGGSRP